ncbi:hypothetical protein DICVIV_05852 [Dictyocaulus viviparus]|uniref:Uncharacterized protein n=1 Tax=Dictyocaulus viviparus TaxID=29172 RepID=A0A0D8XW63_DICVI|nr:hypothetical protein DICVIV_05852 [Dictyocaulus viviparus]
MSVNRCPSPVPSSTVNDVSDGSVILRSQQLNTDQSSQDIMILPTFPTSSFHRSNRPPCLLKDLKTRPCIMKCVDYFCISCSQWETMDRLLYQKKVGSIEVISVLFSAARAYPLLILEEMSSQSSKKTSSVVFPSLRMHRLASQLASIKISLDPPSPTSSSAAVLQNFSDSSESSSDIHYLQIPTENDFHQVYSPPPDRRGSMASATSDSLTISMSSSYQSLLSPMSAGIKYSIDDYDMLPNDFILRSRSFQMASSDSQIGCPYSLQFMSGRNLDSVHSAAVLLLLILNNFRCLPITILDEDLFKSRIFDIFFSSHIRKRLLTIGFSETNETVRISFGLVEMPIRNSEFQDNKLLSSEDLRLNANGNPSSGEAICVPPVLLSPVLSRPIRSVHSTTTSPLPSHSNAMTLHGSDSENSDSVPWRGSGGSMCVPRRSLASGSRSSTPIMSPIMNRSSSGSRLGALHCEMMSRSGSGSGLLSGRVLLHRTDSTGDSDRRRKRLRRRTMNYVQLFSQSESSWGVIQKNSYRIYVLNCSINVLYGCPTARWINAEAVGQALVFRKLTLFRSKTRQRPTQPLTPGCRCKSEIIFNNFVFGNFINSPSPHIPHAYDNIRNFRLNSSYKIIVEMMIFDKPLKGTCTLKSFNDSKMKKLKADIDTEEFPLENIMLVDFIHLKY